MKTLIRLEEAAQLILSIILFAKLPFAWWLYPALILLPDVSMIGYVAGRSVGAFTYNLAHHKGVAIGVGVLGLLLSSQPLLLAGILLFGHSALDRMLGYGLKYSTGFGFTHLGELPVKHRNTLAAGA